MKSKGKIMIPHLLRRSSLHRFAAATEVTPATMTINLCQDEMRLPSAAMHVGKSAASHAIQEPSHIGQNLRKSQCFSDYGMCRLFQTE